MAEPDPLDPLGRIADQGSRPYPAPEANRLTLVRHWEGHYASVALDLSDDALTAGIADADRQVADIGRNLQIEFARNPRHWRPLSGKAASALEARQARLEGMRAAYVAEAARRAGVAP